MFIKFNWRLFIFLLYSFPIFFIFTSLSAHAACNFKTSDYLTELSDINSANYIEVKHKNYRKWNKNALRIISSPGRINSKNKKNFKAMITIHYPFGVCKYSAKVRQSGDNKDQQNDDHHARNKDGD